jgi:GT2 family glycosyltransferase
MIDFTIGILNKHPELAENLICSILATHDPNPQIVVVADNHDHKFFAARTVKSTEPFVAARNINIAMAVYPHTDFVFVNDDMECIEDRFFFKLQDIAYQYKRLGILSPLIDGGVGNQFQQFPPIARWADEKLPEVICLEETICFPCVYLKREMIQDIGVFDEGFTGYGHDDDDYCLRAREKNWLTGITRSIAIKHGTGGSILERGKNWSTSFAKEPTQRKSNIEYFLRKHPHMIAS